MGKLPAYLHWAKDWLTDVDLCRCSKAAKGVWIDVLDTMFLNCIRGVACTEDGKPWSDADLARAIGGDITENVTSIRELLARGVARRNANGAIYSRRMVADEKERQSNKERQQRHRHGESNAPVTVDVTDVSGTGTVKAFEVDVGFGSKKPTIPEAVRSARFALPALGEIQAYCQERNNRVDPGQFFNYYTSNGWKVGRNQMRDWRAAVRTWERNNFDSGGSDGREKPSKSKARSDLSKQNILDGFAANAGRSDPPV